MQGESQSVDVRPPGGMPGSTAGETPGSTVADAGRMGMGVVLVTGAGGGLGQALVQAFRGAGWRVAAAGHREAPLGEGDDLLGFTMNVTDRSQCERGVASILERWGQLDVLINNAGVTSDRLVMEMTDADWDRVIDVHLKGAFLCSRAALPAMVRQGDGQILNISSFAARSGGKGQVNYAAAKAGLIGLTLSLAREVAEHGVRVNAVLPGLLPTKLTRGLPEAARKGLVATNLLNRMNGLEEVATLVVGLAKTRDVSGQVLQWDSRIGPWT